MADADEDEIPRNQPSITASNDPSYDPEDEAQDFRFLASLTPGVSSGALPKRGEKDFEPNPTRSQASILNDSREAMHNALSVERFHPPRNTCIGQYLPDEKDWRFDAPTETTGGGGRCVVVERFKGTHNKTLGKEDYRNWTWLLPEEALFLLERGSLDVRWPDGEVQGLSKARLDTGRDVAEPESDSDSTGEKTEGPTSTRNSTELLIKDEGIEIEPTEASDNDNIKNENKKFSLRVGDLPMSLQGAYASFIGKNGLTLERYNVYAGLKRLGYIVQRAPTWDDPDTTPNSHTNGHIEIPSLFSPLTKSNPANTATNLINRLVSWLFTPQNPQYNISHGPILNPGIYRSYNDIFRTLTLIPYHQHNTTTPTTPTPNPPFQIHFNVHKPSATSTSFKKSNPPPPDFRICVLDARTTSIPTLEQISDLLDSQPEDIMTKDSNKKMETRLKHGLRNVVLAVVDCGLVSYLRLADAGFGDVGRVFEEKVRRGGKGGGGGYRGGNRGSGSGRGRGRGRGRGGRS